MSTSILPPVVDSAASAASSPSTTLAASSSSTVAVAPTNVDSDSDTDAHDAAPVDESTLTPAQLTALQASRRERITAKNRRKKEKQKAAAQEAKKRKREEKEEKQGRKGGESDSRQVAQKTTANQTANVATAASTSASNTASSSTAASSSSSSSTSVAASTPTFGLAAILAHKKLRGTDPSHSPPPSAAPVAATGATPAVPASTTNSDGTPSFVISSLSEWRALSSSRPELRMNVVGEDVTAKRLADKRAAIEAAKSTGMGGGYKAHADGGWECQSYNCIKFVNFKNDTQCKRCGSMRRF